jgi:hypothetical protein
MIGYYYTTIEAGVILAKKMEEKDYMNDDKMEDLKINKRKTSGNSSTDISH